MVSGLPNLFVVGAAKAGTTALHHLLDGHPDVFMPRLKEPHFFAKVADGLGVSSMSDYLALYDGAASAAYRGDSSPSYMWDADAPELIARTSPGARIIILVREPAARAYSHYLMDVVEGSQHREFEDALRADTQSYPKTWGSTTHLYFELGLYSEAVRRFHTCFGESRVLVVESANLRDFTGATMDRVFSFLGLPAISVITPSDRTRNAYRVPRNRMTAMLWHNTWLRQTGRVFTPAPWRSGIRDRLIMRETATPPMDERTARDLAQKYGDDIAALRDLCGEALPSLDRV